MKSVLVIFGKKLPNRSKKWFEQFDKILEPKELAELVDPGSVQESYQLFNNLSRLTLPDGSRLPNLINYRGYELWWMNCDKFMDSFCLPYTQYRRLLSYLKDFKKIYLYESPYPGLFQYYFNAYDQECIILDKPSALRAGILIQTMLSLPFLLWLKIVRPKLMVWTSDQFDPVHPPHDFDFRMRCIYEELRSRKIPFVEFIRSQESWLTVLRHALRRKRPVVYSAAIIALLYTLAGFFQKKQEKKMIHLSLSSGRNQEERFWFLVATHRFRHFQGTIWAIRTMEFILRWIGIKSAIIPGGSSRTFHEILACKLQGIKSVGIQHGLTPRYFTVGEFMSGFEGQLTITNDMYGLWSDWWKDYYMKNSKAYKPEQLFVSGHMRPLAKEILTRQEGKARYPIKVLFVADQLAAPQELMPYFSALLEERDFSVYVKFRAYRDILENWLKENQPQLLEKVKVIKDDMHAAISQCDITVGCQSTGVLESVLQFKPFVFFRTGKWGNYFDLEKRFFADNPQDLVKLMRENLFVPKEILVKIQDRFFGDPYRNGSRWVVEQAIKDLRLKSQI